MGNGGRPTVHVPEFLEGMEWLDTSASLRRRDPF